MAKAVKLADIAEQVGVSTVTVSKALSGQKGVSEEMREKIKNLAEELGYRSPSETKRQSAEKQYNIGVLIQEVYLDKYDSFYWKMYPVGVLRCSKVFQGRVCWKTRCRFCFRKKRWMV